MSRVHTHYDNLKVARNAPYEVIRAAYRVLAQKYHPDVNGSADAARVMAIINEAWAVLGDEGRRAEHDAWIAGEESIDQRQNDFREMPTRTSPAAAWDFPTQRTSKGVRSPGKPAPTPTASARSAGPSSGVTLFAVVGFLLFVATLWWMDHKKTSSRQASAVVNASPSTPPVNRAPPPAVVNGAKAVQSPSRPAATLGSSAQRSSLPEWGAPAPKAELFLDSPTAEVRTGYVPNAPRGAEGGLSTFTVDNSKGDTTVLARLFRDGRKPAVRSFYVMRGEKFTARSMTSGTYVLRYRNHGSDLTYEADRSFFLREEEGDRGTRYSNVTVTLFPVTDGNLSTKQVSGEQF